MSNKITWNLTCMKCGETKPDVRVIRAHRFYYYCETCCLPGREGIQMVLDNITFHQKQAVGMKPANRA